MKIEMHPSFIEVCVNALFDFYSEYFFIGKEGQAAPRQGGMKRLRGFKDSEFGFYHLRFLCKLFEFFMVRVKRDSLNEYWATVEILDRFVDLGKRKGYQDMRNIFVCFTSPAPKGGTYARKYMNYTELQAEIVNRGNKTLDEVSRSVDVDKSIDELSE